MKRVLDIWIVINRAVAGGLVMLFLLSIVLYPSDVKMALILIGLAVGVVLMIELKIRFIRWYFNERD